MNNISSPRTGDDAIEQEILAKGLTAPRVTMHDIEDAIRNTYFFTAKQGAEKAGIDVASYATGGPVEAESLSLLTFCVLVLRSGFTVVGTSACASPANFDADIGKKVALENAKQQLWPLLGFALKERLAAQAANSY